MVVYYIFFFFSYPLPRPDAAHIRQRVYGEALDKLLNFSHHPLHRLLPHEHPVVLVRRQITTSGRAKKTFYYPHNKLELF